MDLQLNISQKQVQKLVMTQQMQLSLQLLQMNTLELEQLVSQELLENPMLTLAEEAEDQPESENQKQDSPEPSPETPDAEPAPDAAEQPAKNLDENFETYLDDNEPHYQRFTRETYEQHDYNDFVSDSASLQDHLLWQLHCSALKNQDLEIGEYIIGNIDDDGYLRADLEDIAHQFNTDTDHVQQALSLIQTFEPAGVGARTVAEALAIQARILNVSNPLVLAILDHHFEDLEHRRMKTIAKALNCTEKDIQEAVKIISHLEPHPGREYTKDDVKYIVPDVFVKKVDDDYMIFLNEGSKNHIMISPFYRKMLLDKDNVDSKEHKYAVDKYNAALWLIKNIERRKTTILRVTRAIISHQREFLEKGISALKPLTLRVIADEVELHESTVARVTSGKYVETPRGNFELKFFFSSGLSGMNGDVHSSKSVKDVLKNIVDSEPSDKPYSDAKIVSILKSQGIDIARRTVSKYREQLKILPAKLRKKI